MSDFLSLAGNGYDNVDGDRRYAYPFLDEIVQLGYLRMERSECQKKVFCRMANYGRTEEAEEANAVQSGMRRVAKWSVHLVWADDLSNLVLSVLCIY